MLRLYLVYRALVRAKIARLRSAQLGGKAPDGLAADFRGYLDLAESCAQTPGKGIVVMRGLAGSGKTTASQALLETIGVVRTRSDVERKRMHGLAALDRSAGARDLYAPAATEATYDRLRAAARTIVGAGWTAIVDATFLRRSQREMFRALAIEFRVPFVIVDVRAREATLRERIVRRQARANDASDASLAVLAQQIETQEALAADEQPYTIAYDSEAEIDSAGSVEAWEKVRARLS